MQHTRTHAFLMTSISLLVVSREIAALVIARLPLSTCVRWRSRDRPWAGAEFAICRLASRYLLNSVQAFRLSK